MIRKVEKVWGHEEWIVNNRDYCGKRLVINKGYQCSIHYHERKRETFYVSEGEVLLELYEVKGVRRVRRVMKPGDTQEIISGQKHRFTGLEDSVMFEFSTHHEDSDSYRDTESGKVDLDSLRQEGVI